MKSLQNKLYEGFYKNAGGMVCPTTREELENEISIRLSRGQTNLNDIDTSKITDMSYLFFADKRDLRNLDISKWDTSNVTDMRSMFYGCNKFNFDLSRWDTSKVEHMECMFSECFKFNSDLSKWDVRRVEDMHLMFSKCYKFNCDLSKWKVNSTVCMQRMFIDSGMKVLPSWYKEEQYND